MNLPFFIARRYLFAKKSHNVINIISSISAIGIAIGAAALIITLSIYNGFDSLVKSSLSNVEPDILITPSKGKVFIPEGEAFDWAYDSPLVKNMSSVLSENVFISYDGHQSVAMAKGVDSVYEDESPISGKMLEGKFALHQGDVPLAVVGAGLSYKTGISPRFLPPIEIYFPFRDRNISLSNPSASLNVIQVWPSGVFSVNTDVDNSLIIIPIEQMRELLGYDKEVSGVEIRLVEGHTASDLRKAIRVLSSRLGEGFTVCDRYRQNEALYKMMKYEKGAIYLILLFIVIIIAFNIFGCLSMLIIEKRGDIETFRSMGAEPKTVDRFFILEGWLISLTGLVAGLFFGLLFTFAQQKFGFIKMPGDFMVTAYPIIVNWTDVLLTAVSVAVVGYLIAFISVKSTVRR